LIDPNSFFQSIVSGLLLGAVYGLVAVGLNLIYGVMETINFAHGEFVMLSMYIAYLLNTYYNIDPIASLLGSVPVAMAIGLAVQRLLIRPTLNSPLLIQSCITFGLLLFLQNAALLTFGADFKIISVPILETVVQIGYVRVSLASILAAAASIISVALLYMFLKYTFTGTAIRATGQNRWAAFLLGIPVDRIHGLSFALAAGLAAVAGTFTATIFWIHPTVGEIFILRAFIIVVLGGMGNVFGAFVGGLIIAVAESLGAFLLSPSLKEAIALALFIIVLLFRPWGMFARARRF